MSFFNSLQQMVTSSVANLSLSPKRFSFSKESSGEPAAVEEGAVAAAGARSASVPGFPKVVPPPGALTPPRRRTMDGPRRVGSFRQASTQPHQRPPLVAFCRRRLSWPEVDLQATSGREQHYPQGKCHFVIRVGDGKQVGKESFLGIRKHDGTKEGPDTTEAALTADLNLTEYFGGWKDEPNKDTLDFFH